MPGVLLERPWRIGSIRYRQSDLSSRTVKEDGGGLGDSRLEAVSALQAGSLTFGRCQRQGRCDWLLENQRRAGASSCCSRLRPQPLRTSNVNDLHHDTRKDSIDATHAALN